jgi:hypothetical protein
LHELRPCRVTAIEFHALEPELGIIQEVECGECHAFVLWCLANKEIALAPIEPR